MSMFDRLAVILHRERMNDNGDCVQILHLLLDAMREPAQEVIDEGWCADVFGDDSLSPSDDERPTIVWKLMIDAIKAGK